MPEKLFSPRPYAIKTDHAGALLNRVEPIGGHMGKRLGFAGWPSYFDAIYMIGRAQAKMNSQIVLGKISTAAADLIQLAVFARSAVDARSDPAAVRSFPYRAHC